MYDYTNHFMNPYLSPQYQSQFQPLKQEVVKVNGENGARAFAMGPNSSALLLDESGVLIWLVITDGAGYKTVTPYNITPHKTTASLNYENIEQRLAKLEEFMYGFTDDSSTTKHESNTGSTNRSNQEPNKRTSECK